MREGDGRGLLSSRRRVSACRIQRLREGDQVILTGVRRPIPVGGGPRDPEWFREAFRALPDLRAVALVGTEGKLGRGVWPALRLACLAERPSAFVR